MINSFLQDPEEEEEEETVEQEEKEDKEEKEKMEEEDNKEEKAMKEQEDERSRRGERRTQHEGDSFDKTASLYDETVLVYNPPCTHAHTGGTVHRLLSASQQY